MESASKESRLLLAIQSIKKRDGTSIREAARIYNVSQTTLRARMNGRSARQDLQPNSTRLTKLEEEAMVRHVLDLDLRGFSPRLADVKDIANLLLADRNTGRVGKRWALNYVKRQPELKTRLNRPYDYQRALCEDPERIQAWFNLVWDMRAKYGIEDADVYNFDETGFMMGVILPSMVVTRADRRGRTKRVQPGNREWATVIQGVNADGWCIPPFIILQGAYHLVNWYSESNLPPEWVIGTTHNGWTDNETGLAWIQHFDRYTASRVKGAYRMLLLDGHESHHSAKFNQICKDRNIITICMPPHSSHLLQPLDVGCFSPLKRAYSRQIEGLIKSHINHVTKLDFLIAFREAFFTSMTKENVKAGFRGSGLVPLDPEAVLSKLDVRLGTPTSSDLPPTSANHWVSQTPHNSTEAVSQSTFIKTRISRHQSSSPTPIYTAVDQLARGTQALAHTITFLNARVHSLEKANRELSKRRRAKKNRLQHEGMLSVEDGQGLINQKDIDAQLEHEIHKEGSGKIQTEPTQRHCSRCGRTGHNSRTCK